MLTQIAVILIALAGVLAFATATAGAVIAVLFAIAGGLVILELVQTRA